MRRLLDQPDERGCVARNADDLDLSPFDAQLRDVGVIGKNLRQRFEGDHG